MDIRKFQKADDGKLIKLDISNAYLALLNSLRRVILAEIPNVAASYDPYNSDNNDINIMENESNLHNEFLGHRISLIPLHFDMQTLKDFDATKFQFRLRVQNTTHETKDVTTEHIEVLDENGNLYDARIRSDIFPANSITGDHILIMRLKPGRSVHIEWRGRMGTARLHARWCPVSSCAMYAIPDEQMVSEERNKLLRRNDVTDREKEILLNRFDTIDSQKLFKTNEFMEMSDVRFHVESECYLSPYEILIMAGDVLLEKLKQLRENLDNPSVMTVSHIGDPVDSLFQVTLKNQDHTIGNLMQSELLHLFFRSKEPSIEYAGYHQPHPLENIIVLK
jgi:DNA-directed RNA polymerase alpha subunit